MMKYIVSGLILILGIAYLLIFSVPTVDKMVFSSDADAIERGRYLVAAGGCLSCHRNPDRADSWSGGLALDTEFGTFHVPNISPDPESGIGSWSAEEFVLALKHGRRPDGGYYFPAFPYRAYAGLSDQEILDMGSYLMSMTPELHVVQDHDLPVWLSEWMMAGWNFIADILQPSVYESSDPQIARGAKLARNLGHCGECHTPRNAIGIPIASRAFAGATMGESHADAIDAEALRGWSTDDFAFFLFLGMKPDEEYVGGEMEAVIADNTSQLSEEDRQAMAAFFKYEGSR